MPALDEGLSPKANSARRPKAVSTEALLDVEKARQCWSRSPTSGPC